MRIKTAFTLMEILIVLVIMSILATVTIPAYNKILQKARDREAITNLRLIQAAQRIYHQDTGFYYPPGATESVVTNINNNLHLFLNNSRWDYSITGAAGTFNAEAIRRAPTDGYGNYWIDENATTEPTCVGTCP